MTSSTRTRSASWWRWSTTSPRRSRGRARTPSTSATTISQVRSSALVVVSGLPGAGKTTVARPLAAALGVPLLAKDAVKEALLDALGTGDRAWSQRVGAASMDVLFALAADAPAAVVEAFWRRPFAVERLTALGRAVVEVHCACPPDVALARYRERVRHPGHGGVGDDEVAGWADDAGPLALGGPLLEVDTTTPVDVPAVAAWVRDRW